VRQREQSYLHLPSRKIKTIYHGVDVMRFKPVRPRSSAHSGARIVCVAHLIEEKGIQHLLKAFARMRDPTALLAIIGDGPLAATLRALSVELKVEDRVSFLGLRDDVQDLIDQSDIFVHPATWSEAFGFTIAEAMAGARAVIASRVGGIPEIIDDGVSGLLVKAGSVTELTAALDRLNGDAPLRLRLGEQARRCAMARFNLGVCVQAHLDWYEELAASTPARALSRLLFRGSDG
jgi:glycosyltransferase involved in cell wall biosynthesis